MDFSFLMDQVKRAIFNDPTTPHREGHDPSGLIGNIEQIFGNFGGQQVQPPMGQQVLLASQDPLGDPADQQRYPNLRPASEDPLGDPADQR
jgi:hypothetical protein